MHQGMKGIPPSFIPLDQRDVANSSDYGHLHPETGSDTNDAAAAALCFLPSCAEVFLSVENNLLETYLYLPYYFYTH